MEDIATTRSFAQSVHGGKKRTMQIIRDGVHQAGNETFTRGYFFSITSWFRKTRK